jgi:RNA polymerase sigma factor (sigma-70 family)
VRIIRNVGWAVSGKEEALEIIVSQRPALVAYARRLVGDPAMADDVVQEAWIRLRGLDPAARLDEPAAYVRTVIRNLALDYRRLRDREQGRSGGGLDGIADVPADIPGADVAVDARRELQQVLLALAELPDRVGLAVRLHRLEGLKLREIAERLGVSTATAHALVAQGLLHCARRLARSEV